MAQLVLHFGWTWVGTIAADDDYGKYGIKDFKEQVEEAGVCISFAETLPKVSCVQLNPFIFHYVYFYFYIFHYVYFYFAQHDVVNTVALCVCLNFR